jgi:hypothetical protein
MSFFSPGRVANITIPSPVVGTNLDLAACDFMGFLSKVAESKNTKYKTLLSRQGVGFSPLVVDAFGSMDEEIVKVLRSIALDEATNSGDDVNVISRLLFQKNQLRRSSGNGCHYHFSERPVKIGFEGPDCWRIPCSWGEDLLYLVDDRLPTRSRVMQGNGCCR